MRSYAREAQKEASVIDTLGLKGASEKLLLDALQPEDCAQKRRNHAKRLLASLQTNSENNAAQETARALHCSTAIDAAAGAARL